MAKPHILSALAADSTNSDGIPRPDLSLFAEALERLRLDENTDGQPWPGAWRWHESTVPPSAC
ncbi:hypothetical protein ABIA71_000417 [Stenotrophomonas sp. 2619]|uniref:hypothetical protein n=1 Tax=Stenotrophomonas sp. 2619 TaxID=3156316 RepID=UPI0033998567